MDVGEERETIVIEPIEEPVPRPDTTPPEPTPTPAPSKREPSHDTEGAPA
jgi:hypothetical protein